MKVISERIWWRLFQSISDEGYFRAYLMKVISERYHAHLIWHLYFHIIFFLFSSIFLKTILTSEKRCFIAVNCCVVFTVSIQTLAFLRLSSCKLCKALRFASKTRSSWPISIFLCFFSYKTITWHFSKKN